MIALSGAGNARCLFRAGTFPETKTRGNSQCEKFEGKGGKREEESTRPSFEGDLRELVKHEKSTLEMIDPSACFPAYDYGSAIVV